MAILSLLACHSRRPKQVELWLGGDVNLGDGGHGQLQGIAGMVSGAPGIVNLEGAVSQPLPSQGKLRLWNSPAALRELTALNVRVAGIANNHAADAGPAGTDETARTLRENGILPGGGNAGTAFFTMNNVSIAVTAHDLTGGVPANLAEELAAARQHSDLLIATFHVTGPPSYLPRPELQQAVEIAYHAGANVILSHGTHALGPVERRSHAVIAWGVGNVVVACDCTKEEDAMLLRIVAEKDKVIRAEVLPLQAGINNRPAQPAKDANAIFDLLEAIGSSKLQRNGNSASF